MTHSPITSLHSPHVDRVKALLGSRGKKLRSAEKIFIADGLQSVRSALKPCYQNAPGIVRLYLTEDGLKRLIADVTEKIVAQHDVVMVSDQVMLAMADTVSPQGILALCKYGATDLARFLEKTIQRVAYFWQLQDPGNAGTAIRAADACGFDLVIFSDNSVDIHGPKVVRSTVGSLWNVPIAMDVTLAEIEEFAMRSSMDLFAFDSNDGGSFLEIERNKSHILVFGNEGHGLPTLSNNFTRVTIPMKGNAESFNVASAAAIGMYFSSQGPIS